MSQSVQILEVAPRDGLQNESKTISTDRKIELIERAMSAGLRRLEVVSFVHPQRVPQMADAEDVVNGIRKPTDCSLIGLSLNKHGTYRALATDVDEVGMVCVSTDTFSKKNQGRPTVEVASEVCDMVKLVQTEGRVAQVTIAAAFGCPFEGEVSADRVAELAKRFADVGIEEIALADTIGVAVPTQIKAVIGKVRSSAPNVPLRIHLHDTRNTGLANAWAAVEAGCATIDASIGGLGGCPFAPAATGNVPTEDVEYLLMRSGISTGLDLNSLCSTARWIQSELGLSTPGQLSKAGPFPSENALEPERLK